MMKTLSVHDVTVVDQNGTPKIRLSADSGEPELQMFDQHGTSVLSIALEETGLPSVTLRNPNGGSSASLSVDPKGAHVKFDHPSGASSYLFLSDQGASGIVFLDKTARRRFEVLLNADGTVTTGRI